MNSKCDVPLKIESSTGRSLIVFAFFSFLGISLWFTPLPNAPEVSCDRPCHELEWPRICRLKFVLESHTIPQRNCSQSNKQCSEEELPYNTGSKLLTVNRRVVGPKIHVCVHDILLIDVVNQIPEYSISLHWRGQTHQNDPLMNGVPMINQCPIPSFTTFQYKFRASDPGTHTWHLHSDDKGIGNLNNIYGLLVVRESRKTEPHNRFIDYDESDHSIILRTLEDNHQSIILINGVQKKSKSNWLPSFEVAKNKRYRFRIAHAGGVLKCPIMGHIEQHNVLVIALDGNAIEPVYTTQFVIVPGERLDFVLTANKEMKAYDMRFEFDKSCHTKAYSHATLNYTIEATRKKEIKKNAERQQPYTTTLSTTFDEECNKTITCLENINNLEDSSKDIRNADIIHYLFYNYDKFEVEGIEGVFKTAQINNISFIYPPSPLTSQISDIPEKYICNEDNLPSSCLEYFDNVCRCTHVLDIQKGSVVELVLIHNENSPQTSHIFHLHGYKFHVLGRNKLNGLKTPNEFKTADKEGNLVKRNINNPVKKDTIAIPAGGIAVLRFLADNAGHWLLQEEGGSKGMEVVFNVIGSQYNIPETFPRCGNWIGPKYFFA